MLEFYFCTALVRCRNVTMFETPHNGRWCRAIPIARGSRKLTSGNSCFRTMLARSAACLALVLTTGALAQPVPKVASGTIERLENFPSKYVDARHVDVWLPEGYTRDKRYNVLYVQDGQMLFDATTTWNKQAWNIDAVMARLMREGAIADTIVVGVWNNAKYRYAEYFPEKFLAFAAAPVARDYVLRAQLGKSLADNYLRFLVEELKPAIDRKYSTRPDAAGTFVMGSSMGGLISLYAISEYPQVFVGAACLSTHWVGRPTAWGPPPELRNAELPLAAFNYLRERLPDAAGHRLYMDHGTVGLDAVYAPYQAFVDEIVREHGYHAANWQTRVFEGARHDEASWAARVEIPILFLLGRKSVAVP